jgi:magnesium transporter
MEKSTFENLLDNKNYEEIVAVCKDKHPAETADWLYSIDHKLIWKILLKLESSLRSAIFSHLPLETQTIIAERISRRSLSSLFEDMSHDDRADLFKNLTKEVQDLLIPALAQAEREDILKLSSYPEKTAGAVMTSEYIALYSSYTVAEAIEKIRLEAPDTETVYYAYIIDKQRSLKGFVSLKDLILAKTSTKIETIMNTEPIYSNVADDQEDVARRIQKYDLIAIPVVDDNNTLVGIITHDDAIDIITQEQTEDIEKLMAISGSHEAGSYLKKSAWVHFKDRSFWVISLAILGLFSGVIIHSYEDTLTNLMLLALYMPMMADTGGNTGGQSATVIVRAIALKEVTYKDIFKVIFKEFQIALLLSGILAMLTLGKVLFLSQNTIIPNGFSLPKIAFTIAFALSLQVLSATTIGSVLPLIANKLKLDPALVASPALTTIVDITGLVIYFTSAKIILGV